MIYRSINDINQSLRWNLIALLGLQRRYAPSEQPDDCISRRICSLGWKFFCAYFTIFHHFSQPLHLRFVSDLLSGEVQVQHRERAEKGMIFCLIRLNNFLPCTVILHSKSFAEKAQLTNQGYHVLNRNFSHFFSLRLSWPSIFTVNLLKPDDHMESLVIWSFVFVSLNGPLDLHGKMLEIRLKDIPHVCCTTDLQVYSRWGLSFPCVLAFADPNRWQIGMFADLEAWHCWKHYQKTNVTRFQTAYDLGHDKFPSASRA